MPEDIQDPTPAIARNLRLMMEEKKTSLTELSKLSEISEKRIARFVAAQSEPTTTDLLRLAGAMNAEVSQLLRGMTWRSDGEGGGAIEVEQADQPD